uniref:Uncharacterized protein n=1 Tax=Rhizophora mucronata TaxID=61149 RepID=A0A2P2MZ20_RHIMU
MHASLCSSVHLCFAPRL